MRVWVGIDPGKTGAMALITESGQVAVEDWVHEVHMHEMLHQWKLLYHIVAVALEDTHVMRGNSAKSDTTFQRHCGAWECLIKLAGFNPVMVYPQKWMKRRVPAKKGHQDKPSVPYVERKYPQANLYGPRGGGKDGRADAICIAEWCRDNHM